MASKKKLLSPKGIVASDQQVDEIIVANNPGYKKPLEYYPKQVEMLRRTEHEICFGGAKGGGKTIGGMYFLMRGNLHEPTCATRTPVKPRPKCDCKYPDSDARGNPIGVNWSYVYHPKYLGCVLRKNATDLLDWVLEAKRIFSLMGGEYKEGDRLFKFPSGATIFTGHYQEDNAFTKYQGLNIVRFVVEEVTQLTDATKKIKMLKSCNRSMYPEMKAQILLTCNPGGPSHGDILDRFIEPKDDDGNVIPPGTTIREYYDATELFDRFGTARPPGIGEKIESTRVFIPSAIKDNPAAINNPDYLANLLDMDEELREAYLFGNWHVLAGEYFRSWRPAPHPGEPENALHVHPYNIISKRLKPWYWRVMACDWGYSHECATGWGCHDQSTGQLIVEAEMVVNQTEPDVVGEEIARRTKPLLKGLETPSIIMGLSHDAYSLRQDDRSVAELMGIGMARILGPNMVHLPDLLVDQIKDRMEQDGKSTNTTEVDAIFEGIRSQQRMGITIKRVRDNRIVGWQYVQTLLRWRQSLPDIREIFNPNLASKIAYERGQEAYTSYLNLFKQKKEILPKLLVAGPPVDDTGKIILGTGLGCPRLINAIPKAVRDELNPEDVTKKHVEGASDLWDMLRYLCLTYRGQTFPEPFAHLVQRRISEVRAANPDVNTADLIHLNRKLEAEKNKKTPRVVNVIRAGRGARAVARGVFPAPQ